LARKKIIIDTDVGCDDAVALLFALRHPDVEIMAITTVFGNVSMPQATENVGTILRVFHREDIPFFAGTHSSLLEKHANAQTWEGHGKNGLGDYDFKVDKLAPISSEHASNALVRLINDNVGEIDLVCLGPLTNVALALKLDHNLPAKLKSVTVMGGSIRGRGNLAASAEFNFHLDPEAVHMVLTKFHSDKLTMIDWDITEANPLTWTQFYEITRPNTMEASFVRNVTQKWAPDESKVGEMEPLSVQEHDCQEDDHDRLSTTKQTKKQKIDNDQSGFRKKIKLSTVHDEFAPDESKGYLPCDAYAMLAVLEPRLVLKRNRRHCVVGLTGEQHLRGHLGIDFYTPLPKEKLNVTFITELDVDFFARHLSDVCAQKVSGDRSKSSSSTISTDMFVLKI